MDWVADWWASFLVFFFLEEFFKFTHTLIDTHTHKHVFMYVEKIVCILDIQCNSIVSIIYFLHMTESGIVFLFLWSKFGTQLVLRLLHLLTKTALAVVYY